MSDKKGFAPIVVILVVLGLSVLGAGAYFFFQPKTEFVEEEKIEPQTSADVSSNADNQEIINIPTEENCELIDTDYEKIDINDPLFKLYDCNPGGIALGPFVFYKTTEGVFLGNKKIQDIDPKVFSEIISNDSYPYSYYEMNDDVWFYDGVFGKLLQMEEVNKTQINIIGKGYMEDGEHVYYKSVRLPDANLDDFRLESVSYNYKTLEGKMVTDEILFGVSGQNVFERGTYLEGVEFDGLYMERWGLIIRDHNTGWFLSGSCDFTKYVPEPEIEEPENDYFC